MLQQEEYRCGDHRMACRIALAVRRPISAELPWTLFVLALAYARAATPAGF